jgi:hypothetical protein
MARTVALAAAVATAAVTFTATLTAAAFSTVILRSGLLAASRRMGHTSQ